MRNLIRKKIAILIHVPRCFGDVYVLRCLGLLHVNLLILRKCKLEKINYTIMNRGS